MRVSLLLCASLCLVLTACQSKVIDNSMIVEPVGTVSYADDVQPLFDRTCGGNGCHINEAENGVNVTNYQQTITSVGSSYNSLIVIPGDGDGSPLVDKLGLRPRFGSRMPLGNATLTGTEIAIIKAWVDEGANDN